MPCINALKLNICRMAGFWYFQIDIEAWCDQGEVMLHRTDISRYSTSHFLEHVCSAAPPSFIAGIRTFSICTDAHAYRKVSEFLLFPRPLSSVFPNLETLHLDKTQSLCQQLAVSHREGYRLHLESATPLVQPFPKLRQLTTTSLTFQKLDDAEAAGLDASDELLSTLRDMLKIRKGAGSPLNKLGIYGGVDVGI